MRCGLKKGQRRSAVASTNHLIREKLDDGVNAAAQRLGIEVSNDLLHELTRCVERGGGPKMPVCGGRITEYLLMYLKA